MARRYSDFERPTRRREIRRGGGIGGKIVAVFIGIIIGAGAVVGTVAGLGYAFTKKPVKEALGTVNSLLKTDIKVNEYLSDEYSAKTIGELIGSLSSVVTDIKSQKASFSSLAKISPAVEKAVGTLANEVIKFGVTIEKDALVTDLMEKPFSQLGTYLSNDVIGSITLGALLQNSGKISFADMCSDQNKIVRLLLYGIEGEDYTIDTANKKFTPVPGGTPFLTVNTLGDINAMIENIPLDALLPVAEDNGPMNALAYGSSQHYTYVSVAGGKKEAVMNPRYYTLSNNVAYDETGTALACTVTPADTAGEFVLTFGSGDDATYQYLAPSTVAGVYEVYTNSEKTVPVRYKKTTFGDFMDKDNDMFNSLEIAALLNLDDKNETDKIMLALAYGIEGEDYYYDAGVRKFYANKGPKTIGDLTKDNAMSNLINKMPLDSLLNINAENDMLVTLAYGKSSRYEIITETVNGKQEKSVRMLQVRYTKTGDTYYDIDGNETVIPSDTHLKEKDGVYYAYKSAECKAGEELLYTKTTVGQLSEDGFFDSMEFGPLLGISPLDKGADTLMIALAYGNEGEHFEIKDVDGDGNPDIVWLTDGNGNKYAPRTVAQFRTPEKLFEEVYIADALKVTKASHSVLIALAYGEYEIVGDTIVPEGKKRTVGQLMNAEESNKLIDSITLANALSIDANTQSAILKTLAFGQLDRHYTIVTEGEGESQTNKIKMLQVVYTKDGDTYYDIDGKAVTVTDGVVDGTNHRLTEKDGVYYAYDEENNEITYAKTTLGELGDNPEALIDKISLGDALGVEDKDGEDPLKRALAYSKDGKAYTIGELKENPNEIIYNIHLDSVMTPTVGAKTTLYLLYGRENVHFRIVNEAPTADPATATKITDNSTNPATTKYVEMLPQQMTVHYHEIDRLEPHWCVHNEYGELVETTVTKIENGTIVTHPFDNKEYRITYSYVLDGVTYYLLAPANGTPEIGMIRLKGKTGETGLTDVNRYSPAYYVMTIVDGVNTYPMYEHNTIAVLADSNSALFTHLTERLTLEELMDNEELHSNMFLSSLAHTTIDELPDAINDLKIVDVFEDKVYKKVGGNYVNNENHALELRDGTWYDITTNTVSARVFEGPWKYLLDDCNDERAPESYTVTEMDLLIPNMTANMQKATLNALDKDQIIDLDDGMLATQISANNPITGEAITIPDRNEMQADGKTPTMKPIGDGEGELNLKTLGEMTVEQMLAYIQGLLTTDTDE